MKRCLFSILLIVVTHSSLTAQGNNSLLVFDASQTGSAIRLDFTIKQGNTCNDLRILRSIDGVLYAEVGLIEGVCGSSTEIKSYTFIDSYPIPNHVSYYKLDMALLGFSDMLSIRFIDYNKDGVVVLSKLANKEYALFFQNPSWQPASFSLFDISGRTMQHTILGSVDQLTFSLQHFTPGIYLFNVIIENSDSYSGKIILR